MNAWDHPRMRGEHRTLADETGDPWGSSPHARGTHVDGVDHGLDFGIIPACAGNTED